MTIRVSRRLFLSFFIFTISEFCFPTGPLCFFLGGGIINRSTFSPFLLIFTCTEDSVVGKKKSYLFGCVHYLISEFGNKA